MASNSTNSERASSAGSSIVQSSFRETANEEAEFDINALFDRMASEILALPADAHHERGKRLALLPDDLIAYCFGGSRDQTTEEAVVATLAESAVDTANEVLARRNRLASRAAELRANLVEEQPARECLADRLDQAATRFVLSPWQAADAARYCACLNNPALWRFIPEEQPTHLDEALAAALIEFSNTTPNRHEVLSVRLGSEAIAQVRLQFDSTSDDSTAEISYWLAVPYWGRGLASQFVALATAKSFEKHSGIDRIEARVMDGNAASSSVLEKAHYRFERYDESGYQKDGELRGMSTFAVYRADYPGV